jgi:predicted TIM-barrel fold metal-dependent hydrolase
MPDVEDFDIIDAHVHLYRSLALEKQNVQDPGRRDRDRWGNPESVSAFMDREGISSIVCLPNFPTRQMRDTLLAQLPADQSTTEHETARTTIHAELLGRVRRQNEWLIQIGKANPRLVPAVGIQKLFSSEQMVEEVRVRAALGARTVKLLPGFYFEYPDDRAFWPMYEEAQALGLAITSDTGTLGFQESGAYYGEPIRFVDVLEAFPRLRVVMAHFPSAFWDERVELALRYPNLYFDVSGSFGAPHLEVRDEHRALAFDDAVRVLRKVGVERFMFGSDGPRFRFQPALQQVLALDLTESEKRAILAGNARRIYGIDE